MTAASRSASGRGEVVERDHDKRLRGAGEQTLGLRHGRRTLAGARRRGLGLDARFDTVPAAVVAALGFRHERPSRKRAREAQHEHDRLGAGVAEAHALDRADALAQQPREPHLAVVRGREGRPARGLPRHRRGYRRVGVAVDERCVVREEIEVDVPVDVDELTAPPLLDEERVRPEPRDRACVAARHDPRRLCGPARRCDRPRCVHRFDPACHAERPYPREESNPSQARNERHRLTPSTPRYPTRMTSSLSAMRLALENVMFVRPGPPSRRKTGSPGCSERARMRVTGRAISRDPGSARFSGTTSVPQWRRSCRPPWSRCTTRGSDRRPSPRRARRLIHRVRIEGTRGRAPVR